MSGPEAGAIAPTRQPYLVLALIGLAAGFLSGLFGVGGGDETAERLSEPDAPVTVLGRIPISIALRSGGDLGAPIVASDPTDPAARAITAVADALLASGPGLAGRPLL